MKVDTFTYGIGENSVLIVNRAIVHGLRDAGMLRKDHTPPLNPGVDWNAVSKMKETVSPGADVSIFQAAVAIDAIRKTKQISPNTKIVLQRDSTHCKVWKSLVEGEQEKFGIHWEVYPSGHLGMECDEYDLADKITVLSHWVARTFERYGLGHKVLYVGPQAFDRHKWPYKPPPEGKMFRVLFSGQTGLRKGLFYLLEAWKRLCLKNAELVIAGLPEPSCPELGKEVEKRIKDTPNTIAPGFLNFKKMPGVYASCHVLCIPSIEEGSTMTGLEAMSVGRPVIATPNAGIDILRHWKNGFIIEPRNWENIADAIHYYYSHRDVWYNHSIEASKSIKGCDVKEFGARYAKIIKEAFNGN